MLDFCRRWICSSSGRLISHQGINDSIVFNDSCPSQHPAFAPPDTFSLPLPVSFLSLSHSLTRSPFSVLKRPGRSAMATSVRIVIVGDVHDDWDLKEDSNALHLLQPDLALFTGDFGNENVELVRSISNLDFPKAAILGNHDCWGTYDFQQKKETLVQLQLDSLGKQHVGYSRLDMPLLKLSVVGGRPFSSGGDRIFRPKLLSQRYGVRNLEESKKKIINAALGAPDGHSLVFLAHNGPSGLGSKIDDICGKDWVLEGGDHGDPDLAQALLELRNKRLAIPLVVFGHMHKGLAHGGLRKMVVVGDDGTIYLNGAIVPRVKKNLHGPAGSSRTSDEFDPEVRDEDGTLRAFNVVDIEEGRVVRVSEAWVLVTSKRTALIQENILFQRPQVAITVIE